MQKKKSHEHSFMDWSASAAPTMTVVFTGLSFASSGVISYYYLDLYVFQSLGQMGIALSVAISVIMQGGRFVFLVLGQRDMANGHTGRGIFGFVFSLGLTIFTHMECVHAASAFSGGNPLVLMWIKYSILGITWIGQFLEIRLLISTSGDNANHTDETNTPHPAATTNTADDRALYEAVMETKRLRQQLAELEAKGHADLQGLRRSFTPGPEQMNHRATSVGFTLPTAVKPGGNPKA